MSVSAWSIENGGHFLTNVNRVRDALASFQPGAADFLSYEAISEELDKKSALKMVVDPAQIPVWQAVQLVGLLLDGADQHVAQEIAWRIAREKCRRKPPESELITNTLSALYECAVYLLISKSGFGGRFLRGQGLPDLLFPRQRLLVECKDCQVDWFGDSRTSSVELRIRERIAEGLAQLDRAYAGNDAIKAVFIDLPDRAIEQIGDMSEDELASFQANLVDGIPDASTVFFTHFQVHQHLDVAAQSQVAFAPFQLLNPIVDLHLMTLEVADLHNRLRYFLRGQDFPVPIADREPLVL